MEPCRGCLVHEIKPDESPYENKCPGGLYIFIDKCPCTICLVKVICKDGCELFRDSSIQDMEKINGSM